VNLSVQRLVIDHCGLVVLLIHAARLVGGGTGTRLAHGVVAGVLICG
jgi:hypothetical protein